MTLEAIDHVQAAMPAGEEERARAFYRDLLGLPERPKPAGLARRGGCWFESGAVKVHLGVETPFTPAKKAHIAFRVDDVAGLAERARAGGFQVVDDGDLPGHERVFIYDPFGNRLEFLKPSESPLTMLSIQDLHVRVAEAEIIKGLTLDLPAGEVHAIMGPNGAGKSTLAYALAGRPGYEVTGGAVTYDGEDLLAFAPNERAARGVFLSFQYPLELPGVPGLTFLRTALNAQRKGRGEDEIAAPAFLKLAREKAAALKIDFDMLRRPLNVGFSGGEKKRMEIFQMSLFSPRLLVLDETDSGLDIDALKVVADGVNAARSPDRAMLVITHYQRLLDYIRPDRVHVLAAGRIAASGGPELAHELEREGYDKYARAA